MFGGNQTEQRQRRERIWAGIGFLAFFGVPWWLMATDRRTETAHMVVFWTCVVIVACVGFVLAWRHADTQKAPPAKGGFAWIGIGILLSNLLDSFRVVIAVLFGSISGFCLGMGLGLVAIVLIRPMLKRSFPTE